jgi:hypothetical protein
MMKSFLSILAIASAVFYCTPALANTPPAKLLLKVETVDQNHLTLHLANLQMETTVLSIQDFEGTTYFRQTINDHNGYAANINLEALPEGRYLLHITGKDSQIVQVVVKAEDALYVSQPKASK